MTGNPPTFDHPWQIRDLSQALAGWIDRLGQLWLEAQIAQLTLRPGARTAYLTLRDTIGEISVSAVAIRSVMEKCKPYPQEGDKVLIKGKMEFHPLRGSLQVRIEEFHHIGIGQLLARIEQLRTQLASEGLFDPLRKKKPPFLPHTIGLITGAGSAAEQDVLEVSVNRWPAVRFAIRNTLVQGVEAPKQIIAALKELDALKEVDIIIIARGGGSVEDLLPFSNEALCRAVAECTTPIVSAIGHEPDHPLLDEVADIRAATPTDAAKRIVPDIFDEEDKLAIATSRLNNTLRNWLHSETQLLNAITSRPIFTGPQDTLINTHTQEIENLGKSIRLSGKNNLDQSFADIDYLENQLLFLSPRATLARGYSIIHNGRYVIRSMREISPDQLVSIQLIDGKAHATINSVELDNQQQTSKIP